MASREPLPDRPPNLARRGASRAARAALRAGYARRPAPLGAVVRLRRLVGRENGLALVGAASTGADLDHPGLSRSLAEESLGVWRASAGALDVVERWIRAERPEAVLEFGSGISTVCVARYLADAHGESETERIVSVEQDDDQAALTRGLLDRYGAPVGVRLIHAPLRNSPADGEGACSYEMTDELVDAVARLSPSLAFLDGPAGRGRQGPVGGRFATMRLVGLLCPGGCRVLFDDALDDDMLMTADRWRRLPGVRVDGVIAAGRGVGVARVETP